MTDMHREAFERGIRLEYKNFDSIEAFELDEDGDYYDEALIDMWRGWQAAMRYRDEQEQTSVWRCYKEYMSGDGGRVHSEKFAKTKADMLIFKSQGYDCEKLCDEQEKQA